MRWDEPQKKSFVTTRESVAQASTAVTRPRQAIRSPPGRFKLRTGSCLNAGARRKVLSRSVWQQETDVSRKEVLYFGKGMPCHRVRCVQISTVLGGQTVYFTD